MVRTKNRAIPLIEFNSTITELLTKTEAIRESDDYNLSSLELEFLTKTAVEKESDESDLCELELQTKTFVEKEADDYDSDVILSEMYTKTKQLPREGDDLNNGEDLL